MMCRNCVSFVKVAELSDAQWRGWTVAVVSVVDLARSINGFQTSCRGSGMKVRVCSRDVEVRRPEECELLGCIRTREKNAK